MKNNEVEVFDNRMVDFTKGFSHSTDLQKKISNLLQSSEIIQQKQKDLVTMFTLFSYFVHIIRHFHLIF